MSEPQVNINIDKMTEIINSIQEYSSSLTQRTIILHLLPIVKNLLSIEEHQLRKLLIAAFKKYEEGDNAALQKIAMLDGEERMEALRAIKRCINEIFLEILVGSPDEIKAFTKKLNRALDNYINF